MRVSTASTTIWLTRSPTVCRNTPTTFSSGRPRCGWAHRRRHQHRHQPLQRPVHDPPPARADRQCPRGLAAHQRRRRLDDLGIPVPDGGPSNASPSQERSRLPVNPLTGYVDILVNPNGMVVPTTIYSVPSSVGMAGAFLHFWVAEREDVNAPPPPDVSGVQTLMGSVGVPGPYPFYLPMPLGSNLASSSNGVNSYDLLVAATPSLPYLKGEMRIVTLFSKNGQNTTNDNPVFNVLSVNQPFVKAQQGIAGEQQ